jgi:hypothetical protein
MVLKVKIDSEKKFTEIKTFCCNFEPLKTMK